MAYPPAPPLVLTRRLSSFLHSSLESLREQNESSSLSPSSSTTASPSPTTLQTALLVTPSGKLLAYDSPLPVRTLRTHCSVAASLWAIHAASAPSVSVALNQRPQPQNNAPQTQQAQSQPSQQQHQQQQQQQQHQSYFLPPPPPPPPPHTQQADDSDGYQDGSAPVSIAASFNGGAVFVVRKLRCGLLFACSTPSPSHSTASRPSTATVDPASVVPLPVPPESAPAVSVSVPASDSAEPSTAVNTQSSLLPHATLPIHPRPPVAAATSASASDSAAASASASADASNGAAAPTPIAVPGSKEPAPGSHAGDLVGSLIPGSAATAATYETAHTGSGGGGGGGGGEHKAGGLDAATGHDANADTASVMTSGTTATVGGGGGGSGPRHRKRGSVAATLVVARRQVDELARLLDEKLGTLIVPDDNIGLNGFC